MRCSGSSMASLLDSMWSWAAGHHFPPWLPWLLSDPFQMRLVRHQRERNRVPKQKVLGSKHQTVGVNTGYGYGGTPEAIQGYGRF